MESLVLQGREGWRERDIRLGCGLEVMMQRAGSMETGKRKKTLRGTNKLEDRRSEDDTAPRVTLHVCSSTTITSNSLATSLLHGPPLEQPVQEVRSIASYPHPLLPPVTRACSAATK